MISLREERMWDGMLKIHLEGLMGSAVIHDFTQPDLGDPHDHPFGFVSFVMFGGYVEEVFQIDGSRQLIHRKPGDSFRIAAGHIHHIVELPEGRCQTLMLPGQHERVPGFYQFRDDGVWHKFWNGEWAKMA